MKVAIFLGAALLLVLPGCDQGVLLAPVELKNPLELKNLRVEDGTVWPVLHVDVENVSAKTVKGFRIWATLVDADGRPVYGFFDDDRVFESVYTEVEIEPGDVHEFDVTLVWFLHAHSVVEHGVCEVAFGDGTEWVRGC